MWWNKRKEPEANQGVTEADLWEIKEAMRSWEIRMEEVHETVSHALRRMGKRAKDQARDAEVFDDTVELVADPITAAVHARRNKGNALPFELSG
jgi:hypothetical protein